ncbi:gluconate:H+ symporter [Shimwellia blattae]|uniref:Gluconate transport system permease 3 n=1 Tax=Shimwellia blattae (strain ATCC 29907 / DSM 4481 / JCM 1650 / NBRC 105725 / CDC 9005-74) TaxID=630626 RepID=I2BBG6_SHIBC|nr:gluconate:H+ symporter [Shimwellia blattae]AFJ47870.1 gluconate transport system permease 3 [Shimwellia blattae DSM 4481 = NBRC 105725]GAB79559.1 high-affinity gluconate transporter GntP [Shimwellia blattae DSM 4481 = NBRC 105725]VDY65369.1 Gnt-III system [Shimwellia blattae]VEC24368.1 Gnt-III system [Shimwellia blattae]
MSPLMSLLWVLVGIVILIVLNIKFKFHNVFALLIAGIFVAIMEGIPVDKIVSVIQQGLGGIMGHLALIIIFGAIIGKFMTESGASQQIADTVIRRCGTRFLPLGLMFIGVIFGIAMFYEVAFLIAMPLVMNIAKKANIPYMKLVVPTVVGATMGHSLFPPQPGPVALISAFHADIVQVYIYGAIVLIPSLFCAGILLPRFLPGIAQMPLNAMIKPVAEKPASELPSFGVSIAIPLIPAILMILASVLKPLLGTGSELVKVCDFLGSAEISMLLATMTAIWFLGARRGMKSEIITANVADSIAKISNVLFVISAGGILKQVIIDSGVGDNIVHVMSGVNLSPFIVAWIITAIIRILTGQGAVAAITSAGIVAPMIDAFNMNPALMALAVACGSNTITLMYDGGFLLFKETFGISMKDTFKTWGLLELINSVVGLLAVIVLSWII